MFFQKKLMVFLYRNIFFFRFVPKYQGYKIYINGTIVLFLTFLFL